MWYKEKKIWQLKIILQYSGSQSMPQGHCLGYTWGQPNFYNTNTNTKNVFTYSQVIAKFSRRYIICDILQ